MGRALGFEGTWLGRMCGASGGQGAGLGEWVGLWGAYGVGPKGVGSVSEGSREDQGGGV